MDTLEFRPLTRTDAEQIVDWRYDGPYAQYDIPSDERDSEIEYMADPSSGHFAAVQGGVLVGYVSTGSDGRVPGWDYDDSAVDVGAGMRPDLTGHGRGAGFLEQALAFVASREGDAPIRATIASWNKRAQRAAGRNGLAPVAEFQRPDGMPFTVFVRPAGFVRDSR